MNEMLMGAVSLFKIIDERILLFINGLHAPFVDWWMWWISEKTTWIPLYLVLAFLLFRRSSWQRAVLCLFFIVLVIAATDQTCAALIRPLVGRLRPSNPANALSSLLHLVNGYRGGSYGFPSCHVANSFALAVFLSLRFRRTAATVLLLSWAALISYSRIYLGVHYPATSYTGWRWADSTPRWAFTDSVGCAGASGPRFASDRWTFAPGECASRGGRGSRFP